MKVLNILSIIDTQWRGREGGRRKGEGEEEREKEKKKGGEKGRGGRGAGRKGERESAHMNTSSWDGNLQYGCFPTKKKGRNLHFPFLKHA